MAFAPPKKSFTPGDSSDSPVRGRLARAAVGAAGGASFGDHDGFDADGNAILGSKHLWLVESQDAPRSPGVATVAAVSRSPGRERPRSERVNAAKGPAFAHLLRQSEHLAKRLHAAHGHLAKAFGAGKETTHMSTKLRLQSGAHALKCVAEAIPVGDALLKNWDDAWSSQDAPSRPRQGAGGIRPRRDASPRRDRPRRGRGSARRDRSVSRGDRRQRGPNRTRQDVRRGEGQTLRETRRRARARRRDRDANATLEAELAASRASEKAAREASAAAEKTAREASVRATADAEALATTRGELAERAAEVADATRRAEENEAAAAAAHSSMEEMRRETTQMRAEVVQMRAEVVPLRDSLARELEGRAAAEKIGDGRVGGSSTGGGARDGGGGDGVRRGEDGVRRDGQVSGDGNAVSRGGGEREGEPRGVSRGSRGGGEEAD